MEKTNPWSEILWSKTSSQALKRALSYDSSNLSRTPLPAPIESLPKRVYSNAAVVRRALGVKIDGISESGWELWSDSDELDDEPACPGNPQLTDTTPSQPQPSKEATDDRDSHEQNEIQQETGDYPIQRVEVQIGSLENIENTHQGETSENREQRLHLQASAKSQPTADDIKHASALKTWAKRSPHTSPPADALSHIARSENLVTLMPIMVPPNSSEPLRAAIISALTDSISTIGAEHVQDHLIIPYLNELKTSATREMLTAIVQFYARHWRPTTILYRHFSSVNAPLNSAVAEVLTRIVPGLTDGAVSEALGEVCNAQWSESTIPLVEALITRCKNSKGVAAVFIPAFLRNVTSLEKSIRFGKLLFFVVKEVSEVRENHKATMENVCGRCKAFLAKRAMALLQESSTA